jgi:CheY-like chemotaxis protein
MKKLLTAAIAIILVSGCTSVGGQKSVKLLSKKEKVNLANSFYLNYPKNGPTQAGSTKNLKENKESAKEVVKVFKNTFSGKVKKLTVSESNLTLEAALKKAKQNGARYLITMDINEWKDASCSACRHVRNKKTGKKVVQARDTADVTIYVFGTKTGTLINKRRLIGSGCPDEFLGFLPVGTKSPEGHFKKLVKDWVKTI